jgi:outer membrane protein assembly factor BamB
VVRKVFVARGVWQNRIFAASEDHSLYAINMDDGERLWHFTTGGKIYGFPRVGEGVVYLTSADHKVYALLANSGRPLWSFTTGGEIHTSALEKDDKVYVGSRDKHFYAVNAEDGNELWRHRMLGYPSSPTATQEMLYLSAQGRVYGFSVAERKMRWCFPLGFSVATSPLFCQRRIYVGTLEGQLVCLKLRSRFDEQKATKVLKLFVDPEPDSLSEQD